MNPIVPYYENDMFPEQTICLEPVREVYLYTLPGKEQYPLPCVHYTLWEHLVNESPSISRKIRFQTKMQNRAF